MPTISDLQQDLHYLDMHRDPLKYADSLHERGYRRLLARLQRAYIEAKQGVDRCESMYRNLISLDLLGEFVWSAKVYSDRPDMIARLLQDLAVAEVEPSRKSWWPAVDMTRYAS